MRFRFRLRERFGLIEGLGLELRGLGLKGVLVLGGAGGVVDVFTAILVAARGNKASRMETTRYPRRKDTLEHASGLIVVVSSSEVSQV